MKRAFLLLLSVGSTIVTVANCGGTSSLQGRACPCSDGYVCCESTSTCLAPGEKCSTPTALPDAAGLEDVRVSSEGAVPPMCPLPPPNAPTDDAGTATPGPDGGATCPSTFPISAALIDKVTAWKPPLPFQNVCTQKDIDALKMAFKNAPPGTGVTFDSIKTALGATCTACAFSPLGANQWQVFVEDGNGAISNTLGSCFAQRLGAPCGTVASAACGRARFRFDSCLDQACVDCSPGQEQACTTKAQTGACKDITADYAKACPDEVDLLTHCATVLDTIATSCGGGPNHALDTKPL